MTTQAQQNVFDFVALLRAQWPKRFDDEAAETAWTVMMVSELEGFEKPVLDEAARYLLRKKLRGFPLLGECVDACVAAKKFLAMKQPELGPGKLRPGERYDSTPWKKKEPGMLRPVFGNLASEIMCGPLGRQAAREGWALALEDFVKMQGRQPTDRECEECRRIAAGTIEIYRCLTSGLPVPREDGSIPLGLDGKPVQLAPEMRQTLIRWNETVMAKNKALCARILGEEAA